MEFIGLLSFLNVLLDVDSTEYNSEFLNDIVDIFKPALEEIYQDVSEIVLIALEKSLPIFGLLFAIFAVSALFVKIINGKNDLYNNHYTEALALSAALDDPELDEDERKELIADYGLDFQLFFDKDEFDSLSGHTSLYDEDNFDVADFLSDNGDVMYDYSADIDTSSLESDFSSDVESILTDISDVEKSDTVDVSSLDADVSTLQEDFYNNLDELR